MKKGKNAIFTIPLELAHGASPPTIPPNSIAKGKKWNNPKDLDEVLDGTVISKIYGVEFTVKDGCKNDEEEGEGAVDYETSIVHGSTNLQCIAENSNLLPCYIQQVIPDNLTVFSNYKEKLLQNLPYIVCL
ncbi:hypothetical protein MRB53_028230 [Persea americana]|uniref:Uncharacterized protein n=1 Tax=Persea americana TaxID=3435 RepID=A0ACC2KFB0_PERAE|nr:hypothetical protein MRB53_028230 [Persea americana]